MAFRVIFGLAVFLFLMCLSSARNGTVQALETSGPRAGASVRMFGALGDQQAWISYQTRFVTERGRVVDTANGSISHSEGQGYGLLLALAAGDRETFQRIWDWTRTDLMVRDDALLAWRWEPGRKPGVTDVNNATDGDLLVAWALAEAAEVWPDEGFRRAARRIAADIAERAVLWAVPGGPLLSPALAGFSAGERGDGPVVNLSYWVFPAFPWLAAAAPKYNWSRLSAVGIDLVRRTRFGPAGLPSEWIAMGGGEPRPAMGFPASFSYNAVRVPLYLAMAGHADRSVYGAFVKVWADAGANGLPILDTATAQTTGWMGEPGYTAIAALTACAAFGTPLPDWFSKPSQTENYYPATLHLLALATARTRYPACFR